MLARDGKSTIVGESEERAHRLLWQKQHRCERERESTMKTTQELIEMLESGETETIRKGACEIWSRYCAANRFGYKFADPTAQKIIGAVCPDVFGEKECGRVVYRLAYVVSDLGKAV
jgi:hypothetical protein